MSPASRQPARKSRTKRKPKSSAKSKLLLPVLALFTILGALAYMHRDKWLHLVQPQIAKTDEVSEALTDEEKALNDTLAKPEIYAAHEDAAADEPEKFALDTSSTVSILLYHDFADKDSTNAMVISVPKFRAQMQAIKDAGLPVIPLRDYLDWRRGVKNIPDRAIILTIDDGWLSVHSHALPVLKEFGYPFTLYLYTNYINVGGRSLNPAQIQDIVHGGGELASHSVSHSSLTSGKGAGAAAYRKKLVKEIAESKQLLEQRFGVPMTSFAYPFGNYNPEVVEVAREAGYEAALTVNGAKCTYETPILELHRYVIHGNDDSTFDNATTFRGQSIMNVKAIGGGGPDQAPVPSPAPGSTVSDRSPLIRVDLSKVPDVEGAALSLKIGGLGEVTPEYDPATKVLSYLPPVRFRGKSAQVIFTMLPKGQTKPQSLSWEFEFDPASAYQAPEIPSASAARAPAPGAAAPVPLEDSPAPRALPAPVDQP